MNFILVIAARNLLRQKRRNLLLGCAIAFATMLLVVTTSFSRGVSSILIDRIIANLSGHVEIIALERDRGTKTVLRDLAAMTALVRRTVPEVREIRETVTRQARATGRGAGMYATLVGLPPEEARFHGMHFVAGDFASLADKRFELPVVLHDKTAELLRVRLHDSFRLRFETISGQSQTATATVVGIATAGSLFDSALIYAPLENLKRMSGFATNETGSLSLLLASPSRATGAADTLHAALARQLADGSGARGHVRLLPRTSDADGLQAKLLGVRNSPEKGTFLDVRTMHESAETILEMKTALDAISLSAVFGLLAVVLVGLVNSLRMTVRERTREIGTMRAIGMQQADVRLAFLAETGFLAAGAAVGGTLAGFGVMGLLALVPLGDEGAISILLVDGRIHFVPDAFALFAETATIVLVCLVAAFFPARRAARLGTAQALGHHE